MLTSPPGNYNTGGYIKAKDKTVRVTCPQELSATAMEIQTLFFATVLLLAHGGRTAGEAETEGTEDECQQLPKNTERVNCCDLPTRHIFGNIRDTIHLCAKKVRGKEEEAEAEAEVSTLPPQSDRKGERKRHFFKQRFRDGCFSQCLFEQQGFLVDNKINKEAITERIRNTFMNYEEWQGTISAVVEKCVSSEITVPENETCKSGSAEVFQCIHKEMYMQCPSWLEDNEYCDSLKNFYEKCPNGPPPEVFPRRKNFHRNRPKNPEPDMEGDIENPSEDM